jgi:hypothetical protein
MGLQGAPIQAAPNPAARPKTPAEIEAENQARARAGLPTTGATATPGAASPGYTGGAAPVPTMVAATPMSVTDLAAPQAVAPTVAPVNVDTTAQDATAQQQKEAIDMLLRAAKGQTPSVAEGQLSAAMNRAAQQQLGVAAQTRGADSLAMNREAMLGIGQQGLEAGAHAATARAAEMTGAREALAGATGQARGQDIDLAIKSAGIQSQISTVDAQLKAAIEGGNRDAAVTLQGIKAQLETQLAVTNADRQLRLRGLNLESELARLGLKQQWDLAMANNDAQAMNGLIQGIVGGAGLAFSDERVKSDVSPIGNDQLQAFASKVADSIFTYQNHATGTHEAGTMAQAVAGAGPLGREVTGQAAPGVMGVDYGRLATLMAAAALRSGKEQM